MGWHTAWQMSEHWVWQMTWALGGQWGGKVYFFHYCYYSMMLNSMIIILIIIIISISSSISIAVCVEFTGVFTEQQ
jgi:hypothetical protein